MTEPSPTPYRTAGGIAVRRAVTPLPYAGATEPLAEALDRRPGVLLASSYEFPGRYSRFDLGFRDPPLVLTARGREVGVRALNDRGRVLLPAVAAAFDAHAQLGRAAADGDCVTATAAAPPERFAEEERSRQPSAFSAVRALTDLLGSPDDPLLGLYGAFGYDIALAFERIPHRLPRPADHRDMVLYLPDSVIWVDHAARRAIRVDYDFTAADGTATDGLPRAVADDPFVAAPDRAVEDDMAKGIYAGIVSDAIPRFARGEMFECVPGRVFRRPAATAPSVLFHRLKRRNPAPYGFLMNLGGGEHLVGASPEMYVRVTGGRVETCPISGTIKRGADALEDAENVRTLLNSAKDEAELTMCTDVDRNDKARVCDPASIRIIGRRQVEMYSRLIHTVDHVEGRLRPGYDALDAFLTHCWAVTVTGAPKRAAMAHIETVEQSPRAWYGGAVGMVGFNGDMNTGLTLRTIRLKDGVAEVRAGATLLFDSDPAAEEAETVLKASALLDVLDRDDTAAAAPPIAPATPGAGVRVLLVDHEDSFVHTLAGYLRAAGAEAVTHRAGFDPALLDDIAPDLVVLSPGPGRPADFDVSGTLSAALARGLPVFGVCLGLQGIVEHFGGTLGQLPTPVHGKPSTVRLKAGDPLFAGLPETVTVGRYHSLYAAALPEALEATARSDDGIVMAVRHRTLPVCALQFHPESLLTGRGGAGAAMIANLFRALEKGRREAA
ncbi:anthranilate synthase component I [Caenispirillum salinarum]|uniref:anthranilate synthase component I n=1 Tax=Caenispirillum salinarum TaxID=859058 RepID=UPI00384C5357